MYLTFLRSRPFLKMLAAAALLITTLSVPAAALTIASCNATDTLCLIPENITLQLPFEAAAGDVVLTEPGSSTVSDVFRIFNNLIDTGAGTGLGNLVFLYSADDTTLPAPSTYSANVTFIQEGSSGITSFLGNGTDYVLGVPEPRNLGLLGLAVFAMVLLCRRRAGTRRGDLS